MNVEIGWGRRNILIPTANDVMNKFIGKPIVGISAISARKDSAIHVQGVVIKVHIANMDLSATIAQLKIRKMHI